MNDTFLYENLFDVFLQTPWFANIANYLVVGKSPRHFSHKQCCGIIEKSAPSNWIQGRLFKIGPNHVLHCYLQENEVYDVLHACND